MARGTPMRGQQLVVPVEGRQVHQHGAAGVGDVGDVPAGQVPDQPGVDGAEQQLAALGAGAQARRCRPAASAASGRRSRWPAAGRSARGSGPGRPRRPARDQPVGAGVLPDDGVGDRLAGGLVPDHRGLALVGDADRGEVGGAGAPWPARRRSPPRRWPRSPRRRARPSRAAGRSAGAPSARRRRCRRRGRRACSARRWCPGRWRRRIALSSAPSSHQGIAPSSRDTARAASRTWAASSPLG